MLQSIPEPAEKEASKDETTARNIVAFKQFGELAEIFDKNQIPFIPLKGIALADTVYKRLSDRYFCDIDLLVQAKDLKRIDAALLNSGYLSAPDEPMNYYSGSGLLPVDLHTDIWYMTPNELEDLWLKAGRRVIGESKCLIMPNEEMIIYSAAHAVAHHGCLDETAKKDLCAMVERWHSSIDYSKIVYKLKNYNLLYPFMRLFDSIKYKINEDARFNIESLVKYVLGEPKNNAYDRILKSNHPLKGHLLMFILQRNAYRKTAFLARMLFPSPFFIARRYNKTGFLAISAAYITRPISFIRNIISVIFTRQ